MFKFNPLVLGEVHNDLVTLQWLIDNIEALYQAGYKCFAYEYDQNVSLDARIADLTKQINTIKTEYQNPATIDELIERMKRITLLGLFGANQARVNHLPTNALIAIVESNIPNIKQQLALHEQNTRAECAKAAAAVPEKELALALLQKVKDLGMSYVGLDENLGANRSNHTTLQGGIFNSQVAQRDPVITKRLAISAKIHDGGVIALIGARHIIGLVQNLPEQFDLPVLKAEKESLSQFRFARIMNPDYAYPEIAEQYLSSKITEIATNHSWFNFRQVAAAEASSLLNALSIDLESIHRAEITV